MNVDEVLKRYAAPTTFELSKGISYLKTWELELDAGDVKFFSALKSDHSITFLILFRAGITNNWCGWMINEAQASAMMQNFPHVYSRIQKLNDRRRQNNASLP